MEGSGPLEGTRGRGSLLSVVRGRGGVDVGVRILRWSSVVARVSPPSPSSSCGSGRRTRGLCHGGSYSDRLVLDRHLAISLFHLGHLTPPSSVALVAAVEEPEEREEDNGDDSSYNSSDDGSDAGRSS